MTTKRAHIAALLLCALAPAVGAAHLPPRHTLDRAWDVCIGVAANDPKGRISTHAAAWPRGFKGCAVVVRDMDARDALDARQAWEKWAARHAAGRALVQAIAQTQRRRGIDWRKFKRQCAAAARKAARENP